MTFDEFFERMEEIQNEEPAWKLPGLGLMVILTYAVAFMIWALFGGFFLPIGCLLLWDNLYKGWTDFCFELRFLGEA
jgi:hypothetical protein